MNFDDKSVSSLSSKSGGKIFLELFQIFLIFALFFALSSFLFLASSSFYSFDNFLKCFKGNGFPSSPCSFVSLSSLFY
jgi:hypothetical protein